MPEESLVLHPRPRLDEVSPNVDNDPRLGDIGQMELMVPMRMAVIALACGRSISPTAQRLFSER